MIPIIIQRVKTSRIFKKRRIPKREKILKIRFVLVANMRQFKKKKAFLESLMRRTLSLRFKYVEDLARLS